MAAYGPPSIRIKLVLWKQVTYLRVCSAWIHYCPMYKPFNILLFVVFHCYFLPSPLSPSTALSWSEADTLLCLHPALFSFVSGCVALV